MQIAGQIPKAWSERNFMGDAAKIICPNKLCQAPNPETHRFCQQCRTPVPKRYLWAVGSGIEAYKPGKLLAERYLLKRDRILLDTKPGFAPSFPQEISEEIFPYLRLFPHRLHVPQVYGQVLSKKGKGEVIWLLEQTAIQIHRKNQTPSLMPELATVWKEASAIRQLNWLWQIAQLWQPLSRANATSSLLEPKLLRVEGPIVRLLELKRDRQELPLSYLGELWLNWVKEAKPSIAGFLEELCQQTIQGQILAEELVAHLEQGLLSVGREQTRTYQIATITDTGPLRERNEDACYPPSGSFYRIPPASQALAVVCDGIGGHEGGNVASNLAIETVVAQVSRWQTQNLSPTDDLVSLGLTAELEYAVCQANDRISERNDTEGRADRQRMGTTLVMALARDHQMYVTHIGDSRVYWITRTGCHQITIDDDVASREVRLGYTLYREALQQMGSGSLVQALGMSSSTNLHPTVQQFVLDEDCIFLLCSDGLSDNDRVEQYWDTEILPVLEGKLELTKAAAKLIDIANTQNGHDNVTVALVYCQTSRSEEERKNSTVLATPELLSSPISTHETSSRLKTQLLPARTTTPGLLPLLAGILVLLGLGGVLAYLVLGKWPDPTVTTRSPTPEIKPHSPSQESVSPPSSAPASSLRLGSFIVVKNSSPPNDRGQRTSFVLYEAPKKQIPIGIVPKDSILEAIGKQALPGQDTWLRLKVCTNPAKEAIANGGVETNKPSTLNEKTSPTSIPRLNPGQEGWIRQKQLETYIQQNAILETANLEKCNASSSSPSPATNR